MKEDQDKKATQLPKPVGYKILIALPEVEDKYDSGLIKADTTKSTEELSTIVGFVIELGPDCYKDEAKFPQGAWCKKGDFVLFRAYSGTRFKVHGKEFRFINDDSVEGIVEDPRGYTRA